MKAKRASTPSQNLGPRSLILIDDRPFRAEASQEFKKLYERYSKHLAEITHHEEKVRPAYYRWFFNLFSDHIKRMEKLHTELQKKMHILERMRDVWIFGNSDPGDAFDVLEEDMGSDDQDDDDAAADDAQEEDFFDYENDGDSFGSRSGGSSFGDGNGEHARGFGRTKAKPSDEQKSRESQIKYFYRKLAQTLHPDLAQETTALSRELWQETQDAYKNQDLEQLKQIWTLVSIQIDALSREVRLFDLRKAVAQMAEKLAKVKEQKRKLAKEDPAWGFDKKSKRELEIEIRSDLKREENALSNAVEEVEEDLKLYVKSTEPRKKKKRPRKEQMSFDF